MRSARRVAEFVRGGAGDIFVAGYRPADAATDLRTVLLLPPFGEELNKSRHVLASVARCLAGQGRAVYLPDLHGTGDSSGDFRDATLATWRADLDALIDRYGGAAGVDLVGVRFGALLAADLADRHPVHSLVLCHPLTDGRQQVNQLLRLRIAAGLMGYAGRESVGGLRYRLQEEGAIEIGGYAIGQTLVAGIEALAMPVEPPAGMRQVCWYEVAPTADRELSAAGRRIVDAWSAAGVDVSADVLVGEQFWATQEIAPCDALVIAAAEGLRT